MVNYELKDSKKVFLHLHQEYDGAVVIIANGIEIVRLTKDGKISHICWEGESFNDRLKDMGFDVELTEHGYAVKYNR